MDEESGYTVRKTTAAKKALRMTDSGSTEAESSDPRRQIPGVLQGPNGSRRIVLAWHSIQD